MLQLKEFDLIYFGTPYTLYPYGKHAAFFHALELTLKLSNLGLRIYSPIVYWHVLTEHDVKLQKNEDQTFWFNTHTPMIKKSDALLVGKMLGWQKSEGLAREVEAFKDLKKPIFYLDIKTLEVHE